MPGFNGKTFTVSKSLTVVAVAATATAAYVGT